MKQTWRWFGPNDTVSIDHMVQAGVQEVVTALHHVPNGAVWPLEEVQERQTIVTKNSADSNSGLTWTVVESLPVSEDIKRQTGDWKAHIEAYRQSLRNIAACGITNICYNFMPVLDWTRTELRHALPDGALCMRFDLVDFALFDIHILNRPGAEKDFSDEVSAEAAERFESMDSAAKKGLVSNILAGLPGAEESYSTATLLDALDDYNGIDAERLRQHLVDFLEQVVPVAEELGMTLSCHPDDPPFPLLGLPRIMSTEHDYRWLTETLNSPAVGITLCSGSLGVRKDNDLPGMMERLGDRVHFLHLRNIKRESKGDKLSFHEAAHLEGETDMVALVQAVLNEEARRREHQLPNAEIPFRPDHGQEIVSDLGRNSQPGYPAIGRLKGLAELRGIELALSTSRG
ncbi:MAG: mannonate dehydratase [Gammaproteobacteria bacterium]|nr:mannonate dehydratase [Gammaproteobacteria bacterium]